MRLLAAAAVLVLAAGSAPAVVPPAAVTARALSGQAYEGTIVNAGDVHSFLLEDFAPMPVSISLKAGKGSALLPDIALFDPAEGDVTGLLASFRKDGAKSVAVKNATGVTLPGRYVLQVKGRTGSTGTYLLKVTAKAAKAFKGSGLVPALDTDSFFVFAPTESLVTLKIVKGTGSTLAATYVGVSGPPCAAATLVPSMKAGVASFTSPSTGSWTVEIGGDFGTGGTFLWTAKVKPVKPSKKPVRVNGGAPFFAAPGPAGGILTASVGQDVSGFAVDALDLCWREVRTKGGGPKIGKNTVQCTTVKGLNPRNLANEFATDAAPLPRGFALGPSAAAALAAGELFQIPRNGSPEVSLDTGLSAILRLLADGTAAYVMDVDGIVSYPFAGGGPDNVAGSGPGSGGGVYKDMAHGGLGLVFALVNGGDLEVRTSPVAGGAPTPLATLSPDPGFQALTARGPDAYFAVSNGTGGASLFRSSACFPGSAIPLCPDFGGPVRAMAADDQNVYALEDDASDGVRLRQIPRGGGESIVLYRGSGTASFTISPDAVGAAGGYAFVQVDDGGTPAFFRVKRR